MLVELTIRDFAIVDRLHVSFGAGFNVLTGETGAGKSIVIDALGAALGDRVGSDVVRSGAAGARVDAAFDLSHLPAEGRDRLLALLDDLGVPAEDDLLTLTREVAAGGRSQARVGGRLSPASTLQRIGELLVDVHGQSEHLSLLRPSEQLDLLDRYAGTGQARAEVAESSGRLRRIRREAAALLADDRELARRVDLLRFQVEEIASATLRPGEDDELAAEQRVLGSAERLGTLAEEAYQAIDSGVRDSLGSALAALRHIEAIDDNAAMLAQAATELGDLAEDLLRDVRTYREGIEANPERLAEVEDRLVLIGTLRRKYGNTVDDVIAFATAASEELAGIESSAERRLSLLSDEAAERDRLAGLATRLSDARRAAAGTLAEAVERELADLGFSRARFVVDLRRQPSSDGLPIGEDTVAFDDTGIDRAEFLLAANPGEPPKPLSKVASGGETARIMLALKGVLGRVDQVPTLVFDEVDVGIGGRTANTVGQKLWGLTSGHQVICVTHLPQVASFADTHLSVVKLQSADRAGVRVESLDDAGRREEVATMMGGVSSEGGAAELLERAQTYKQAAPAGR